MIKWTTEVINLVAAILSLALVVGVICMMAASHRRSRREHAIWVKRNKELDEEHRKFMARVMGVTGPPPTPPPEN